MLQLESMSVRQSKIAELYADQQARPSYSRGTGKGGSQTPPGSLHAAAHWIRPHGWTDAKLARHNFAVQDLGQSGLLGPHTYRYFCVTCRWMFLVVNRRGDTVALDESGQPLPEPENRRRVASFAEGPCPASAAIWMQAEAAAAASAAPPHEQDRLAPARATTRTSALRRLLMETANMMRSLTPR